MIAWSEIEEKKARTNRDNTIPWSAIMKKEKPPAEEFKEEKDFLDKALDALDSATQFTTPRLAYDITTSPVTKFLGGVLTETAGNALQTLGDPGKTLAAKYSPALQTFRDAGDKAQEFADEWLQQGLSETKPANNETYMGALKNAFQSGFYGVLQGDASMLHSDKTAKTLQQAIQQLQDENPVEAELSWEYLTSPHGMTRDFGNVTGSMAAILPSMLAMPESVAARGAAKLGGNAITRFLANQGFRGAAKQFERRAPEIFRYGVTTPWAEGFAEGGHVRQDNLANGVSEDEATRRSIEAMLANAGLLTATNTLEGLLLGAPNPAKSLTKKAIQAATRGAANLENQGVEEALQKAISNAQTDKPYGVAPWEWTPDQWQEHNAAVGGMIPMALIAGAGHMASRSNENYEKVRDYYNKKRGVIYNDLYQNFRQDFSDNAEAQARQSFQDAVREQEQTAERQSLRSWANGISGGKMSSEVYDSIVRNAQELGVDVKHALAQAVAESNGNQDVTSDAGAIGVMQLMPETARELGVNPDDTEQNIRGGIRYLKQMYDRFGDWDSAHAAYNAGAGAVEKHGGAPPYSETRNYVSKINGFLNESPDYQADRNEEIYSGENGKGEGEYWLRQNNNVSFEGAQPQLLNAIDALGKFYFENTGKRLVVTAGTNGSHADGEHSHGAGWKVDVNDFGFGEDGALTTPDGGKGWFADEFIKHGQKLGLGMNWEGGADNAHIDVALDGTQWDGSTETKNFGGFNPQNNSVQSIADDNFKRNYKPPETFADRLNREQPVQNQTPTTPTDNSQVTNPPEPAQVTEQADTPKDFFSGTFDTKSQIVSTADKFLEQLREEGDPQKASLLIQLQRARNNGDIAAIENILKQNNVAISSPTQETIETNPPPPKKLSGQERLIKVASAPVAEGKGNANKRARQGKALLRLAQQNNIEVPSVDTKALGVGSTVKVQEWRDKFLRAGLFDMPQESAEVKQARETWGNFKKNARERGLENRIQNAKTKALIRPTMKRFNERQEFEESEREESERSKAILDAEVPAWRKRTTEDKIKLRAGSRRQAVQAQEKAQQEEYRRWQAKQAKELKELQERQAEAKRLAEVRRQLDEQNNIDEQRAAQIAGTRAAPATEQVQQAEEQNRQKIKAQSQQAGETAQQGLAQTQSENLQVQRNSPQPNEQSEIQPPKAETASNVESSAQYNTEPIKELQKAEEPAAQSVKKEVRGNLTQARSASRKKYQVQYKVVDVKDLITSHKSEGLGVVPNENFPQELQPRDRESVGMQHQPQTIGEHLDPDELLDSPYINLGAPVVRNDGVVLNGNGRAMGIRYAYDNVKENGETYKQSLIRNAERFGLSGEEISKMESPVLVREVPLDLSGEEISDVIGDTTGGARMNAVETASTDTGKITASAFGAMPEDGIVDSETMNGRNFLANILGKVLKPNEINAYSDKQGTINSDGVERAKRTLYAIAYDDETLLRKMSESLNDDLPKISNALKTAAPLIAKVKKFGEENLLHQYDLSAIPQAVNAFRETVKNKQTVEQYLNQETFEGMGLSPESREILLDIGKNKKSAQTMADFFMGIAKGIEEQGEPRGEDMFGNKIEPRPLIDLIREAQEKAEELAEERNNKRNRKAGISLFSRSANSDVTIKNFAADEDLTPQQKLLKNIGQKLGTETVFFDNPDGNFHGAHSNGITYLNVNSKMPLGKVFWHESMHWLKANNPKLYQSLAEAIGITDAQREAYLKETKRNDLEDNAAIDEEIIADAFEDTAKRTGLLQGIAGKNRGLIQRAVQWLKDTMNKFIDTFRNPQGKLTTAQSQALADEFGRIANNLVDSNGEKIFRYNNRTKNIELADGRELSSTETENETENGNKPKYSIGANDNSNESTLQRIKNKAAAWFSGRKALSERRNKRIVQRIEGLTNYKIAFNGVDKTIVDDFHKLIRAPHAYQWETFMPAVSEKIAHVLKLPAQKEMANYITDWILTGALNNTSAEAVKFQKAMSDDPPTAEALIALQNEFKEITQMTPEERYGEKIVYPQKTLTAKIMEKFTKEEWIDDLAPLQKMIDRITEDQPELGAELKEGINPLELARLYRGKGGMISDLMIHGTAKNLDKIKAALQEQYPNVNFKWFKPLDMIIEEAGGQKNLRALEIFAVAKLDKEIFEWNRGHPNDKVTPTNPNEADADAVIAKYEKQFGQAQRDLVSFSRTLLDIRHDAGLITDKQYFNTIKSWKNYIPMARVFDENDNYGFMSSLKGEKTGSERDTYTPIGRLIINANEHIRQAERNKVKQELANLARMGAFAKYIEERDTNKVDAKNHIVFYENGKRKYLQTAPEVVRAVEALGGRTESVMIVKLLHAATKAVTASYTTRNFDFAAGNPLRDLADSYLHNKYIGKNPLPFIMDGFIQIFKGLTGKRANDADFIEWVANGGSQASLVSPDIDYVQRDIDSLGTTFKERFRKNPFSTVLEGLQRVAEHGEQAVRLANYRAARDALAEQRADGKATVEDKRKAALISREASIDFAKAGRSTRVLNRVFAFTNAAVQSWNLDYQRYVEPWFSEEGRKKVWGNYFKLVMSYMVPAVLQAALCYGKDWWKEKKDWEKETYWFFGDTIKIPKGLDVAGRLTAAFTDAALSHWLLNEPVEAKRFLTTVKDAFPSLTTTIFTPLVETALNRSWFRQAPIVPVSEQHLPAHLQYGEDTSPVAKFFGEQAGVSPREIDHMINGYLGALGKAFSGKYLTGGFDELPLVHRFKNVPYKNSKSVQRFYEVYDEQDKLYNGYKLELKRDPKTKPPKELDMALYRRLKRAQESMQRISKLRKMIEADKKLSDDKREEKLLALEKQRIALCQRVLNGAQ